MVAFVEGCVGEWQGENAKMSQVLGHLVTFELQFLMEIWPEIQKIQFKIDSKCTEYPQKCVQTFHPHHLTHIPFPNIEKKSRVKWREIKMRIYTYMHKTHSPTICGMKETVTSI
jgi:hypothetical protein